MPIVTEIETRLRAAFAPTALDVVDESDGCGMKFQVTVVSR